MVNTEIKTQAEQTTEGNQKLTSKAHLMCGWPLILVIIGGLVGGGLGGLAYGINIKIYKSNLPKTTKVILNIVTGIGAAILWIIIAVAVQLLVNK
jgi:hypothetical protein